MENGIIEYTEHEVMAEPLSPQELQKQVNSIQYAMKQVMKEGTHYGTVPGTDKPTLLKPGAEKLGLLFRLQASFQIQRENLPNGHREYAITCTLRSGGNEVGQGVGSCSTMEKKYRYRGSEIEPTGEEVPKEYWDNRDQSLLGGSGFVPKKIDGQWLICKKGEPKENPDIADVYNTVLKMAKKRAHVDAILTVTAASDIFTQDVEDIIGDVTQPPAKVTPADVIAEKQKREAAPAADYQETVYQLDFKHPEFQRLKALVKEHNFRWDGSAKVWRGGAPIPEVDEILTGVSQDFEEDDVPADFYENDGDNGEQRELY